MFCLFWVDFMSSVYSQYTHDCSPTYRSNGIIKFADDATIVGLVLNSNETACREGFQILSAWCRDNNLNLNTKTTKEMDFTQD